MARAPSITLALVALLAAMGGCGPGDDPNEAEANEAIDTVEATSSEAGFVLLAGDGLFGLAGGLRPLNAALAAARRAPLFYRPVTCVNADAAGATVTYSFQGCRSAAGSDRIDGALRVTYDVPPDGVLRAQVRSTGLRVDGAVLDIDTDVTYALREGAVDGVTVTRTTATGPRGVRMERRGGYSLRWESATECASLNGSWTTRVGASVATTEASGLRRCMGRCPQPGGRITYTRAASTGAPGSSVTIDFVGGATARWSASTGPSGVIALNCRN